MATKDAIEALLDNEAWDFRSKIEDELMTRTAQAVQTRRFEVGSSMFSPEETTETVDEEVEGLDELSKNLINRYGEKAHAAYQKSSPSTMDLIRKGSKKSKEDNYKSDIQKKRGKGLDAASKRMRGELPTSKNVTVHTKEEVEGLDEDLDEGLMDSIKKTWQGGVRNGFKNNIHPDHQHKYTKLIAGTKTMKQAVNNLDKVHPDHKKDAVRKEEVEDFDEGLMDSIKKTWQGGVQNGFKNNIHPDHQHKYTKLIAGTKTMKQAVNNLDKVHPDHKKDAVRKEEVEALDELSPELLDRAAGKAVAQTAAARRGFGKKTPEKAGSQAAKFRIGQMKSQRKEKEKTEFDNFVNGK
jgi:hypothetical protein